MPDNETRRTERATERLTIFSDAVVAIAMTLLAIDLPAPSGDTVSEFWTSFEHDDGHYAAFLISFAVIAAAWSNHHELFRYVNDTDAGSRLCNLGWLLCIVLTPFATKLLVVSGQSPGTRALRFGFYALLQSAEAAMLYVIQRRLVARRMADLPPPVASHLSWQSLDTAAGYGLSIPVFFVTSWGWVLWIATPALAGQLRHRHRARQA